LKKALVLGVGSAQVDIIRYLKSDDWWVIGCSYQNAGQGLKYVDQFELVDIQDHYGLEKLGRKEKIDLIYSIGSDLAMPTIARTASALGLPSFVSYETSSLLHNKILFRDFLTAHNISAIKYRGVRTRGDLDGWNCFPAIVKPSDNQGQRGVFLAGSIHDIDARFESTISLSRSGTLIIEEYLEGSEVSANAFVVDGEVLFCEVSDRLVIENFSGGIPKSHVLPTKTCADDMLFETKELVKRCIRALAIENGPVYFQIKLTSEGPRIIEVAPRLDGCHLWRLIKTVGGVDLLEASIKLLTGDRSVNLQMKEKTADYHLNFLFSPPEKEFRLMDHPAPIGVSCLEYYYNDGEIVRPINGSLEKVGYYIEREK